MLHIRLVRHSGHMALLIIVMLVVVVLGVTVVGVVAVPAHRDGRDLLTPKGETVARSARRRVSSMTHKPLSRTH